LNELEGGLTQVIFLRKKMTLDNLSLKKQIKISFLIFVSSQKVNGIIIDFVLALIFRSFFSFFPRLRKLELKKSF